MVFIFQHIGEELLEKKPRSRLRHLRQQFTWWRFRHGDTVSRVVLVVSLLLFGGAAQDAFRLANWESLSPLVFWGECLLGVALFFASLALAPRRDRTFPHERPRPDFPLRYSARRPWERSRQAQP